MTQERITLFSRRKNPELVLYDAITPEVIDFNKQCSKLNFHHHLNLQKGEKLYGYLI